jgi:hypothetical protein
MTEISMPEALVACVAIICFTFFITAVVLKGMDYGLKHKDWLREKK